MPEPGWYPDPVDPRWERRWDGEMWTTELRTRMPPPPPPGWNPPPGRKRGIWEWFRVLPAITRVLVVVALVVVSMLVVAAGLGDSQSSRVEIGPGTTAASFGSSATSPPATVGLTSDPASLLAQRDGSTDVAAYVAALDALQPHCDEDRVRLGGFADAGLKDLEKNGIHDETRLTVLRHMTASIPDAAGRTNCQGILAAYLVLRETPTSP